MFTDVVLNHSIIPLKYMDLCYKTNLMIYHQTAGLTDTFKWFECTSLIVYRHPIKYQETHIVNIGYIKLQNRKY